MKEPRDTGTLQALDRGLRVLELIAKNEMGPTEIATAIGVDRATVHRILRTLIERNFAERSEIPSRYRANLRQFVVLANGMAAERGSNWLVLAKAYVDELHSRTGLSANLAVPSGKEIVYMMQVLGEGLSVHRPPGTRRPIYCSAIGKAYLGSLPEPELDSLLAELELTPITTATITSREELKRHLSLSRAKGYYVDRGEHNPMVCCIASTVYDQFGCPIASVGVSGSTSDPAMDRESELGQMVADVAFRMSTALGYSAG